MDMCPLGASHSPRHCWLHHWLLLNKHWWVPVRLSCILDATRLNFFSTWTAARYFYMMAYRLPVKEDQWGADIPKRSSKMGSGIVHHKSDRKSCVLPTADRNTVQVEKRILRATFNPNMRIFWPQVTCSCVPHQVSVNNLLSRLTSQFLITTCNYTFNIAGWSS